MKRILGWFLVILAAALPAAGQIPLAGQLPGAGQLATAPGAAVPGLPLIDDLLGDGPIYLPVGLPGIPLASLIVGFEQGIALNLLNLGVSVWPISSNNPGLLARLPPGVTIAPGFPLLIRIEPPAAGGLAFSGIARLEVFAPTLRPATAAARRLFGAPTGGSFIDITDTETGSTYRVIGSRGGFSEFLVVYDPTPVDQVITAKLDRLAQLLVTHAGAIPAPVHAELAARLAAVQALQGQGDTAAALVELESFLATVEANSGGTGIPDVWRAARDLVNVAGELRAAGRTLRFSLRQDLGP